MQALRLHTGDGPPTADPEPTTASTAGERPRRLIDLAAVAGRVGVSKATAERMHAAGRLPQPIRLGTRLVRWDPDELETWLSYRRPDGTLLKRDEWAQHRAAHQRRK